MDFKKIEDKWQKVWEEKKVYEVEENEEKQKFYVLEMFPYPSGSGLHLGHALNYVIGDIYSRFKKLQGFNVLHPMGYDALGLPAENAAIKDGTHPEEYTNRSIKNYIQQQKKLGLSYAWSRMINTASPDYYKWDQWIFTKMFEKGLAYQKTSAVNWCPKCQTVLANEQVQDGKCWRHEDTKVEIKQLTQWFLKTTAYAEELYDDIDSKLQEWPERTKAMQKNWIGKSHGAEIDFEINGEKWPVFTTRADTIFGVTFVVVSAQHEKLKDLVTPEQESEVNEFLKTLKSVSEKELETMEKKGVFTGSYATNPATKEKVPVYAGNFVIADYGSGMVMAVPAHDQRDFEFAKKYGIKIKQVVEGPLTEERAYTGEGKLINSGQFNDKHNKEAKKLIIDWLEKEGLGRKITNYKLRDWGVSRQRYWGTPIPIIHCPKCGAVPVPENDLPVKLPKNVVFGEGNPLETNEEFINASCPKCGGPAKRETDTMDTFVNSSWYYLRYTDPKNNSQIFSKEKANYWSPVDLYIGGAEHACMHLIYVRFYTKFLRDLGLINFDEPAKRLFHQGMLHGEDGEKMSKSKGNVVVPEIVSKKYGIDTARLFLMSIASPDKDIEWSEKGIEGSLKLMTKINDYINNHKKGSTSKKIKSKLQRTIKEVTKDLEEIKYNLAIIKLRELFNSFEETIDDEDLKLFVLLLSPFTPHFAEEWWNKLGGEGLIVNAEWPEADESLIDEKAEAEDQLIKQVIDDVKKVQELAKINKPKRITIIISPEWKFKFFEEIKALITKTRNPKEIIEKIMQTELKKQGQEIPKIIFSVLKDASKIPKVVLDPKTELEILRKAKNKLEQTFETEINLLVAEDIDHPKKKNSNPLKPAIILE